MKIKRMLKESKVWIKSMLNTVVKVILSVGYIKWVKFRGERGFTQI